VIKLNGNTATSTGNSTCNWRNNLWSWYGMLFAPSSSVPVNSQLKHYRRKLQRIFVTRNPSLEVTPTTSVQHFYYANVRNCLVKAATILIDSVTYSIPVPSDLTKILPRFNSHYTGQAALISSPVKKWRILLEHSLLPHAIADGN